MSKEVLPPLLPQELARAKEMRKQWIEAFGDDAAIREMVKHGLIRGWRDVVSVTKLESETEQS